MGNADSLLQEILIHWETKKYRADIEIERMKKSYNREWTKKIQNIICITSILFWSLIKMKKCCLGQFQCIWLVTAPDSFPTTSKKRKHIFPECFLSSRWENIFPLKLSHWINFLLNISLINIRVTIISTVRRKMFQVLRKAEERNIQGLCLHYVTQIRLEGG